MIETIEAQGALFAALSRAQGTVQKAHKNSKGQIGQNRNYKYASLDDIDAAIGNSLVDNGLAIIPIPGLFTEGTQQVTIYIGHEGGGFIREVASIPCKADSQGAGSGLTYIRRYILVNILLMVTEDDDGKGAMPRQGGYSDSPDNEPPRASYEPTGADFAIERAIRNPSPAAIANASEAIRNELNPTNPSMVEALIKNTGFPHKGILGAYLKEKDMLTGYRAEDIAAWLSDNEGASGEELLFAAAAYGAEKLDGEFRDKAEAYAKANPS